MVATFGNPDQKTIQAVGGDYATPALWESDTDDDCVAGTTSPVGMLAAETFGVCTMNGATCDATYARRLTYQSGAGPYDHLTGTGPKLIGSSAWSMMGIQDPYCWMDGFYVENNYDNDAVDTPTTIRIYGVVGCRLSHIFARRTSTTLATRGTVVAIEAYNSPNPHECLDVVALPTKSTHGWSTSQGTGFLCGSYDAVYANLVADGQYRCFHNAMADAGSYPDMYVRNCVAINPTFRSFDGVWNRVTGAKSHCLDDDGRCVTAYSFTDSYESQTVSDVFEDAASEDYRPKSSGNAAGNGHDYSALFTTDITAAAFSTLWDIGAYALAVAIADNDPSLPALARYHRTNA